MKTNRPLYESPRFWVATLTPIVSVLLWYLVATGFLAVSTIQSQWHAVAVMATTSFLVNILLPVCTDLKRSFYCALPSVFTFGLALLTLFGGASHSYQQWILGALLIIGLPLVGILVALPGFVGAVLRKSKLVMSKTSWALAMIAMVMLGYLFWRSAVEAVQAAHMTSQPRQVEAALAAGPVFVPAGDFLMGSAGGDADAVDNEKPQHTVHLDAYWIDRVEVTNAMYARCVQAGACRAPRDSGSGHRSSYYGNPEYANYPVVYVSWFDAQTYCQWTGGRLPTEAEWEKAARGADGRTFPWGNEAPTCNRLNYSERYSSCDGDTTAVGAHPSGASPYGALDMGGNVWEWVADWYDPEYYASGPPRNPSGPAKGEKVVLRGGSWYFGEVNARSAYRNWSFKDSVSNDFGFRCIRSE